MVSGRPRVSNDLAVGAEALDFDLLAAEFVPDRLDMVRANLLEPDFLDDSRRLVDQRVLGSLDDLDRAVRPIDFTHESRIGNRLAQNLRMLLVEGYILGNFAFGHDRRTRARPVSDISLPTSKCSSARRRTSGCAAASLGETATCCMAASGTSASFFSTASTCAAGATPEVTARSCTSTGRWMFKTADAWATSLSGTRTEMTTPPSSTVWP